jgi:hypothetical protein
MAQKSSYSITKVVMMATFFMTATTELARDIAPVALKLRRAAEESGWHNELAGRDLDGGEETMAAGCSEGRTVATWAAERTQEAD